MKKTLITAAVLATSLTAASAATIFSGGDLLTEANWSNGLPGDADIVGTINQNGSYSGVNQNNAWMAGSTTTVGGNATLTLNNDLAIRGATMIVNNATINATDDIFTDTGLLILNGGSTVTAVDDFEAQGTGTITINGGTHNSGSGTGNKVGAQGNSFFNMLGGQITAGTFNFDATSVNSLGGGGVLLSASNSTNLSMSGSMNILSSWTGSWEVGSFNGTSWRNEVIGGGWTLNGVAIDGTSFDTNFSVSGDGATLTAVPEPASAALLGLGGIALILRRRK